MHFACNKCHIIWHVLFKHCNICCVRLGRVHWPTAMTVHVPVALVRSPPDMGRYGNHSNQHRGVRKGLAGGSMRVTFKRVGEEERRRSNLSLQSSQSQTQILTFYCLWTHSVASSPLSSMLVNAWPSALPRGSSTKS